MPAGELVSEPVPVPLGSMVTVNCRTVGVVPVPPRVTDCVIGLALSVTVRVAERPPEAEGVKVTLMVQFAPAATEPPQFVAGIVVKAKSAALVPLLAMLVMVSRLSPPLCRVMDWPALVVPMVWLLKERLAGVNVAVGPTAIPLPDSESVAGLRLEVMLMEPERAPAAVGVKVVLMVQKAPGARVAGQS